MRRLCKAMAVALALALSSTAVYSQQGAQTADQKLPESIVRVNVLTPFENKVPGKLVINGSAIDSDRPEIVRVYSTYGMALDNEGHIMAHLGPDIRTWIALRLCKPCRIEVVAPDGAKIEANLVGIDRRTGLAVLRADPSRIRPANLFSSCQLKEGDSVAIFSGRRPGNLVWFSGRVEERRDDLEKLKSLVVSFQKAKPSYGQPVFDADGHVIGLWCGKLAAKSAAPGLLLPMAEALPIAQRIIRSKSDIIDGWLGVYLEEMDIAARKRLGLKPDEGVLVRKVVEGGPAEEAGIRENDLILEYNGTRVARIAHLSRLIRTTPIGHKVPIVVLRDGERKQLTAEIKQRSDTDIVRALYLELPEEITIPPIRVPEIKIPEVAIPEIKIPEITIPEVKFSGAKLLVYPERPRLGVFADNLTVQLGEFFGVKEGKGVLVTAVASGSPAEKAGLRAGDVIVAVDGVEIKNHDDLARELRKKSLGDTVIIDIIRERKATQLRATLTKN